MGFFVSFSYANEAFYNLKETRGFLNSLSDIEKNYKKMAKIRFRNASISCGVMNKGRLVQRWIVPNVRPKLRPFGLTSQTIPVHGDLLMSATILCD